MSSYAVKAQCLPVAGAKQAARDNMFKHAAPSHLPALLIFQLEIEVSQEP